MNFLQSIRSFLPFASASAPPAAQPKVNMGELSFADPTKLFGVGAVGHIYNPNELISRRGYKTIDEMRRDDQIKAAMALKKGSVIAPGWAVTNRDKEKPAEWEPRVFIEKVLKELDGTLEETLLGVLTAMDYGFSMSEKIFAEENGKVVVKAIKTRAPHTWDFKIDQGGNLLEARQMSVPFDRATLTQKFILFSYDAEFSNPYGRTDLEAAYRGWWTKKNAYIWMAMLLERMGVPPIFALYNPNDYTGSSNTVARLREMLVKLQASTVGMIPRANKESIEMWTPELAGQVSTVFIPAFEMFNKDIARGLLMPGLLGLTDDGASGKGSMARSKVHFDVFMLVLDRIQKQLAKVIVQEQIVDPLLALNFAGVEKGDVEFAFLPYTEDQTDLILTAWKGLVDSKIVKPQESDETHARDLLEFPEANPNEQKKWADEAAERAKAEAPPSPFGGPKGAPSFGKGAPEEKELTEDQFERLLEQVADTEYFGEWDESKHPRHPEGSDKGGEFAPKDGGEEYRVLKTSDTVDGREVLDDVPNQSSIDSSMDSPEILKGIREVPMSAFDPAYKVRNPDDRTLRLVEKIKASKTISPLIIGIDDKGPYVIEGGHRFDSLILLKAKSFPAMVVVDLDLAGTDPAKWNWKFKP